MKINLKEEWNGLGRLAKLWLAGFVTLVYSYYLLDMAVFLFQNYEISVYLVLRIAMQLWGLVGLIIYIRKKRK